MTGFQAGSKKGFTGKWYPCIWKVVKDVKTLYWAQPQDAYDTREEAAGVAMDRVGEIIREIFEPLKRITE
jgi:hypothetical protein